MQIEESTGQEMMKIMSRCESSALGSFITLIEWRREGWQSQGLLPGAQSHVLASRLKEGPQSIAVQAGHEFRASPGERHQSGVHQKVCIGLPLPALVDQPPCGVSALLSDFYISRDHLSLTTVPRYRNIQLEHLKILLTLVLELCAYGWQSLEGENALPRPRNWHEGK